MHLSNTVFFFDRDFEIFTPLCVDMRRAALLSAQIDSGGRPPGTGDHTKAGLRLYGCTLSFLEMCCKSSKLMHMIKMYIPEK